MADFDKKKKKKFYECYYYARCNFFYKLNYDIKGHIRSNKAFYVYLYSSNNSSVKPTLPQIVCALVSPIPIKREVGGSLFALWMLRRKLRLSMILKLGFMWPLLCYGEFARLKKMFQSFYQTTILTYVLMDNFCPCLQLLWLFVLSYLLFNFWANYQITRTKLSTRRKVKVS